MFAGGFTLDLAVALMTDEHVGRWDVIDGLATLADRSLVVVNGDDPPRYRLLETMRAYALEQLARRRPTPRTRGHRCAGATPPRCWRCSRAATRTRSAWPRWKTRATPSPGRAITTSAWQRS